MKYVSVYRAAILVAASFLIAGCGGGASSNVVSNIEPRAMLAESYRLDTGDAILVSVRGDSTIDDIFMVNAGGDIILPEIGQIAVRGLTLQEVVDSVETVLDEKGVVEDPVISVEVAGLRAVYVHGLVKSPGSYEYTDGATIGTVLQQAGGSELSDGAYVAVVVRSGPPRRIAVGNLELGEQVFPGDVISVQPVSLISPN